MHDKVDFLATGGSNVLWRLIRGCRRVGPSRLGPLPQRSCPAWAMAWRSPGCREH